MHLKSVAVTCEQVTPLPAATAAGPAVADMVVRVAVEYMTSNWTLDTGIRLVENDTGTTATPAPFAVAGDIPTVTNVGGCLLKLTTKLPTVTTMFET